VRSRRERAVIWSLSRSAATCAASSSVPRKSSAIHLSSYWCRILPVTEYPSPTSEAGQHLPRPLASTRTSDWAANLSLSPAHKHGRMPWDSATRLLLRSDCYNWGINLWAVGCVVFDTATGGTLFKLTRSQSIFLRDKRAISQILCVRLDKVT
jgi:hypothetical protein